MNKVQKTFLASIAALFLATGTAHAGRYNNWKCGDNITLQTAVEKVNPPNSLLKKVFEVSLWATLIQDPSARRTKDSQPSGFGFEYCASHVRFRVFQQTANALPVSYGFYIEGLRIPKARVTIDRDGQPRLNGKRCTWTEKKPE
jgi:hypothetical protein